MPIPSSITDLSATASSNSPSGGDSPNVIDDHIRAQAAIIRQVYDASAAKSETLANKTISLANNSVSGTAAQFNSAVSDADFVTVGGALGTPSSGNLTNCTFPTLNQNTSGTSANLSGAPALPNGTTATTQTVGDNSTKIATTAFVNAAIPSISVKAACVFDGTLAGTNAPLAGTSFNVTSVTRVSTGVYEVNFTNAFADNNYVVNSNADPSYSAIICSVLYPGCTTLKATIKTYTTAPALGDNGRVTFTLFKP